MSIIETETERETERERHLYEITCVPGYILHCASFNIDGNIIEQ